MDWFNQNRHSTVYPNAPAGLLFAGDDGFPNNGANNTNRYNQLAPRAGVVWDLSGDGTQTIRAAGGLYYDSPKLWQYGHHMRTLRLSLFTPLFTTLTIASLAVLTGSGPNDWPGFGNDPGGTKFSPLTQITPANVTRLTVACSGWSSAWSGGCCIATRPRVPP